MSLHIKPVYDQAVQDFTSSTNSNRFSNAFISSINDILNELTTAGDLDSNLGTIQTENDYVGGLGSEHRQIVRMGLFFYMIERGQTPKDQRALREARADWEDAKGDFMMIEQRKLESTVDSDGTPTGDVVGLGYKG